MGSVKLYGYKAIRLPRQGLRELALRKAQERGTKIFYEHRCTTIREDGEDGRVKITFANGTVASADFLVGADGFYSVIREQIFPDAAPPEYTGLFNLSGILDRKDLEISDEELKCPSSSFGPDNFFAFMPTKDPRKLTYLSSFNVPDLGKDGWKKITAQPSERRRLMEEQFCRHPWPPWLQDALRSLPDREIRCWP